MAIQGQIQYNSTLEGAMNTGLLGMKGLDGKYYIKANDDFGPDGSLNVYVSQIDSESPYYTGVTEAQARLDLASLALPGVIAGNWFFGQQGGIVVRGTPYLLVPMFVNQYGSPDRVINLFLRYKIDAAGVLVLDGYHGAAGGTGFHNSIGSVGYWFVGVEEVSNLVQCVHPVGNDAWLVMRTGQQFLFNDTYGFHLVRVPLNANFYSDVLGSWDAFITRLPLPDSYLNGDGVSGRLYTNRSSVMEEPDGNGSMRVFVYLGQNQAIAEGFTGATLLTSLVDPVAHTASAWTDVSSVFGIPFDDTMKNFAGVLTTDNRNDYTAPTVVGTDLLFMRGFSDSKAQARYRFFQCLEADLVGVLRGAVLTSAYTNAVPSGLNGSTEFVLGFKEGTTLYTMGRFNSQYAFGNMGSYPVISNRRWLAEMGPIRGA